MTTDVRTTPQGAVLQLLEELAAAYEALDQHRALELFADDIGFVGTGPDELRTGREELQAQVDRDLTSADELTAVLSDLRVTGSADGGVAWFSAQMEVGVTAAGTSFVLPMRVTGVASEAAGRWRLRQTHFSLPSAGQAEGASFPTPATHDRTLESLRRTIGSGDHSEIGHLYAPDAVFDVNVPQWRFQLRGPDGIRAQFDEWHPQAPRLVEWHERTTSWGAVVELALWEGEDHELYSRSVHVLDIDQGVITRHVMYCTGNWSNEALQESTAALLET